MIVCALRMACHPCSHITDRKQMQADKEVQHLDNKGEDLLN